jgi:GxxExxY protein
LVDEAGLNALGKQVLDASFRVHTELGPGLLESAYTACLAHELLKRGHRVRTEVPVPVVYDGVKLRDVGYRIDLLVEECLVVEVKALEAIAPVHLAQLVSYLKLSGRKLGYLLNFNVEHLRDGVYRRVNGLGR